MSRLRTTKQYLKLRIILACMLLLVCLVIGADHYTAAAAWMASKEMVIADNRTLNHGLLAGGDTCSSATAIGAFPYNDTGTTVGMTDDYDLPTAFIAPTVTGCPTCNATGGGPVEAEPRGGVFLGTGTGPDVAYSITFTSPNNSIDVTVTPTGSDDLALLVYTDVCSSSLSDAIVVDDDNAGGEAEHVVITNMPAGTYNIVVDAYSTGGMPPGPSGPYSIAVTGTGTIAGGPTPTNTATPTATDTPTATATATATATPGGDSILGTVTYGNPASPTTKFISNATVTATGGTIFSTTTAAPGGTAGQYTLTGFGSGNYTVGVTKTTGQNSITSNDAARIAQHVAGTLLITTDRQKIAADSSNNGTLSSNDAALIARFVSGLGAPTGITNTWRFFVPSATEPTFPVGASPTTRSYTDPIGVQTGQDFIGILVGETTGNWTASAARSAYGPEKNTAVELPSMSTQTGKQMLIPVNVQGVANKNVISYEFDLRYDPSVIQPLGNVVDVNETVSRGLSVVANPNEPGLLRVVVYGALPIDKDGLLLNLRFTAVGEPGAISPISFERIMFNEDESQTLVTNGQVEISRSESQQD